MSALSPHAPPRWTVPALRQNALLLRSGRVTLLLLSMAALLLVAEAQLLLRLRRLQAAEATLFHPEPAMVEGFGLLMLLGLGWALVVWWNEGKVRHPYHASMPVDRAGHDLWRVASGILWLMAGTVVFCLLGAWLATIDGTGNLLDYHPVIWLNAFTLPVLTYLAGCAIAMRTNRPVLWFALLVAAGAAAVGLNETPGLEIPGATHLSEFIIESKYGLHAAISGGHDFAHVEMANREIRRAFWTPATPGEYLIANAIWLPLAGMLVVAVARWRR